MAKSFKDKIQQKAANPTLQFISPPEETEEAAPEGRAVTRRTEAQGSAPAHRTMPQYGEETKSRRLQLLLTPSLYDAVKEEAEQRHTSVNEMINTILKDAMGK